MVSKMPRVFSLSERRPRKSSPLVVKSSSTFLTISPRYMPLIIFSKLCNTNTHTPHITHTHSPYHTHTHTHTHTHSPHYTHTHTPLITHTHTHTHYPYY